MNEDDGSQDNTLPKKLQAQNATLQALIEVIDQLVAASRALLVRLQGGANEEPPPPEAKP